MLATLLNLLKNSFKPKPKTLTQEMQAKKSTTWEILSNPVSYKGYAINFDFLHKLEGFTLKGYVSKDLDVNDKNPSGVTIIGGFDLGQQSATEVKAMLQRIETGMDLYPKIQVYIGLVGESAKAILERYPLLLTKEEGQLLDSAVRLKYLEACEKEYNSCSAVGFRNLNEAQQTVIFSVFYQYGSLKKSTPNFFKKITSGDWQAAIKHLENFGDAYGIRRKQEAAYLKKGLK